MSAFLWLSYIHNILLPALMPPKMTIALSSSSAVITIEMMKNQKVVLANVVNVLGGGEANADAPTAGRKALLASRQNMIFSVSMLFFMVGSAHFYSGAFGDATSSNARLFFIISIVITALL